MTGALLLVIVVAQANAGGAQPSATDAAVVARGWTALAAGRPAAAVADADRVLTRRPWDHSAILLKVNAAAAVDPTKALDAYEAWLGNGVDDAGLLEPVAREIARALAAAQGPFRREARRVLSLARVPLPAAAAGDDDDPFVRDAAAAHNGNGEALQRLQAAASDPNVHDKSALVTALEQAGTAAVDSLVSIMQTDRGPAAGDAARALGRLGATQAVPALQAAMNTPDPYVRFSASVALARLGDPAGRDAVTAMVASPVPDVRLMTAEAWDGQNGPWVAAVLPLLDNPDGDIRLRAARLVAPFHPEAARRTLEQAAGDPNPVIRSEALKTTSALALRDPSIAGLPALRARLRDPDPAVRLYAAAGVLALARNGR